MMAVGTWREATIRRIDPDTGLVIVWVRGALRQYEAEYNVENLRHG